MSRILMPRRKLWTPPQRQRGFVVLDAYRGASGGGGGDTDPYWANVTSLLHFDGLDASTTYVDEAGPAWNHETGAELDTAAAKFGPTAGVWAGSTPRIYSLDTGIIDLSTDFTVEFWVYQASDGLGLRVYAHFFNVAGSNNGLNIYRNSSTGVLQVDNALVATTPGTIVIPLTTWTHVAVVRDSGVIRGYVDGVECLSHAAQSYPSTIDFSSLGMFKGGLYVYHGHMDDFRVTNGVCRYPGGTTFTPPSEAFPNS